MNMKCNIEEWIFMELKIWMDGGSITLNYVDKSNGVNLIELVQNVSITYCEEVSRIPGRIYINDELVEIRSKLENEILKKISNDLINQETDSDQKILLEKIEWIKSNEYINLKPIKLELSEERKRLL